MARFFLIVGALAALSAPAGANARSNLEGRWKNGKMEIVIRPCGGALCGTVVKASAKQQSRAQEGSGTDLVGARLITNIRPSGPQTYRANIYLADRGMNTTGTIHQLTADRLNVRGCVLAVICKSTNWDRIGQ